MANKSRPSHCALILPGAVAKGAYEAGVIEVLAEQDIQIDRIVTTSSGALNGIAYASGIRAGNVTEMATLLAQAWVDGGSWHNSLSFNLLAWLRGRGLSDSSGLMKMMSAIVKPCQTVARRDVELRIILAPLEGVTGAIGGEPATTFEEAISFRGEDFDTEEGLSRIFRAVTAASAFPGIFAPVEVPGLGPCVDGGAVNNAPIKYALDDREVNHIIMPIPFPARMPAPPPLQGFGMANHLLEVLINERLYRDLREAQLVNQEVAAIEGLTTTGTLTIQQAEAVRHALHIRRVEVTEIRPSAALAGNAFSGFFSKKERLHFLEEGREAARNALEKLRTDRSAATCMQPDIDTTSHSS